MEWEHLTTTTAGPSEIARSSTPVTHLGMIVPARFSSDSSPTPDISLVLPELNSTSSPAVAEPQKKKNGD